MNRVYYVTAPGELTLKEEPVPTVGRGELLVRVKAVLTCGTDMKMLERGHPKISFPRRFGHEASGIVEEVGEGVETFRRGDRVAFPLSAPCGTCAYCRMGRENLCTTLMEKVLWGTFADYIVLPRHLVAWQTFCLPEAITFAEGALLDPLASVHFAWQNLDLTLPGGILIVGTGPIAYMHALVAQEWGFSPVIVAGRRSLRFPLYGRNGVITIPLDEDLPACVEALTDGIGVELTVDTTGQASLWNAQMRSCRGGGTFLAFAGCEEGESVTLETTPLHYDNLKIMGSFHYDRRAVASAWTAITSRTYLLEDLFSGNYPLEELPRVLDLVREGRGLKFIVEPS